MKNIKTKKKEKKKEEKKGNRSSEDLKTKKKEETETEITEKEYLEKKEFAEFDINDAVEKFAVAQADRKNSGWDSQAEDGIAIMMNDLPLNKKLASHEKWTGKFYVDNWVEKSLRFKKSLIQAADVYIDVCNDMGITVPAIELLENEINFAFDKFNFLRDCDSAIENHYSMGMGWSRQIWDTKNVDGNWRTGKPMVESIDDRKIWIDPATHKPDKSDKRYLFHREKIDTDKLRQLYPEIAEKIVSFSSADDKRNIKSSELNMTDIVTMQYKKTINREKRAIVDKLRGTIKYFDEEEFQGYMKKAGISEDEIEQVGDEYDANAAFSEGIKAGRKTEISNDYVFQVIFIPELLLLIERPQLVGKNFTYVCLPSFHRSDSAYSFGWTHYLKDLLEASIIMMTIQLISTVKTNKPTPQVEAGALENEENFLKNHYKLGVSARVRADWRKKHPGEEAVKWLKPPQVSQMHLLLDKKIQEAIKTFTGSIDVARGEAPYSGMSGRMTGLLQVAAGTMSKPEVFAFNHFLKQHAEILKENIVFYRDYPHKIMGLDENGERTIRTVNLSLETMLSNEDNYCHVIVEENAEAVKASKQAQAVELYKLQWITWRDALRMQNIPNAEKLIDNREKEMGNKQLIDLINSNPELQTMIRNFIETQKGQPQNPQKRQEKQTGNSQET